ncbi:MAG TPA: SDR family oxidoreductase [Opitutales bacterium]|nr:SDR family oxidoreductase [Opitutales bacterium]
MMKSRFPHHKALVTGASSGLGRELCGLLAETGCEIWGVSRDASRVPQTCAHAVALDLADAMAVARFSEGMLKDIAPDLLVNCAGGGVFGDTAAIDADTFAAELRVLLESPALLCRAALPAMLASERGCIANVSSMAVEFPLPCMAPYNAAKAGLSALSRTLAEETRGKGVAVIDFRPGDFSSGFLASTRRLGGSQKAWEAASAHIRGAPSAGNIAADLFEAIARGRSGTVRSGGFFQTRLAPFGARVLPSWAMERLARKYLG